MVQVAPVPHMLFAVDRRKSFHTAEGMRCLRSPSSEHVTTQSAIAGVREYARMQHAASSAHPGTRRSVVTRPQGNLYVPT